MQEDDVSISIDLQSPVAAYRQIVDQIRHHLLKGALKPGETLPGVRRLAIDLGVHHNTVAEAYRTLAEEGWLEVSQGKAVKIRNRTQAEPSQLVQRELQETFRQRGLQLVAEFRAQGLPKPAIAQEIRLLLQETEP